MSEQIFNPFADPNAVPPTTGGTTTPAFADPTQQTTTQSTADPTVSETITPSSGTPDPTVQAPSAIPAPKTTPTLADKYATSLTNAAKIQFPGASDSTVGQAVASKMFAVPPKKQQGKSFEDIQAAAKAHTQIDQEGMAMQQSQQENLNLMSAPPKMSLNPLQGAAAVVGKGTEAFKSYANAPIPDKNPKLPAPWDWRFPWQSATTTMPIDINPLSTTPQANLTVPNSVFAWGVKNFSGLPDVVLNAYATVFAFSGLMDRSSGGASGGYDPVGALPVDQDPITGAKSPISAKEGKTSRPTAMVQQGIDFYNNMLNKGADPSYASWITGLYMGGQIWSGLLIPFAPVNEALDDMFKTMVGKVDVSNATTLTHFKPTLEASVADADSQIADFNEKINNLDPRDPQVGKFNGYIDQLEKAKSILQENGGPYTPNYIYQMLADTVYRLKAPVWNILDNTIKAPSPILPFDAPEPITPDTEPVPSRGIIKGNIGLGMQEVRPVSPTEGKAYDPSDEPGGVTTNILKELQGKTSISRQYLEDALNRQGINAEEKGAIQAALQGEGAKITDITSFAQKVQDNLTNLSSHDFANPEFENVTLPDSEGRGVTGYNERTWGSPDIESPIETQHGQLGNDPTSLGHTRAEYDGDGNKSVLEVQPKKAFDSDLNSQRLMKQEIQDSAIKGDKTIQFPTGETAVNIQTSGGGAGAEAGAPEWTTEDGDVLNEDNIGDVKAGDRVTMQEGEQYPGAYSLSHNFEVIKNIGDGKISVREDDDTWSPHMGAQERVIDINNKNPWDLPEVRARYDANAKWLSKNGFSEVTDAQGNSWMKKSLTDEDKTLNISSSRFNPQITKNIAAGAPAEAETIGDVTPEVSVMGGDKLLSSKAISGINKILRLMNVQPLSPLDFGIGRGPDGLLIDLENDPEAIGRAAQRARNIFPSSVNMKRVLTYMVAKVASVASGVTTPEDFTVAGAYRYLKANPEIVKSMWERVSDTGYTKLDYVLDNSNGMTAKNAFTQAIQALKNDPGGSVYTDKPAPVSPVSPASPSVRVPIGTADGIHNAYTTLSNTQLMSAGLSMEDIQGIQSEVEERIGQYDAKIQTQKIYTDPGELSAPKTESTKPGVSYSVPKDVEIKLTDEQKTMLDTLSKQMTTDEFGHEVHQFPPGELRKMAYQMTGNKLDETPIEYKGASTGFHAVGDKTGTTESPIQDAKAQLKNIASGEKGAIEQPATGPMSRRAIVEQVVDSTIARNIAEHAGIPVDKLDAIKDELTAEAQRIASGGNPAEADLSAAAKKYQALAKSYFTKGGWDALEPIYQALEKGDMKTLSEWTAAPENGISEDSFNKVFQSWLSSAVKDKAALASAFMENFNIPKFGNNDTAAVNSFLHSMGYTGTLDSVFDNLTESNKTSVARGDMLPADTETGNIPSKYYHYNRMLDPYFQGILKEGRATGVIKGDASDDFGNNYLPRATVERPLDYWKVGDEDPGMATDEELQRETSQTKKGSALTGKTTAMQRNFSSGGGRVFKNVEDLTMEGYQLRTMNADFLMKNYGYSYARANATQGIINMVKAGNIGNWFTAVGKDSPDAPPSDWVNLGDINDKAFHQAIPRGPDALGNPQGDLGRDFYVHPSFYDKIEDLVDPKRFDIGNKTITALFKDVRSVQAYTKYWQMALSWFHPKQLGLTAAAAAGPETLARWFTMSLDDPQFMETELEMIGRTGMTSTVGKTISEQAEAHLTTGEDSTGENVGRTQVRGLPDSLNNPLTRWVAQLADKNQDLIFNKMQRFIKVTDYAGKMAKWMEDNPGHTLGELQAAQVRTASLVNGFFGGLNWQAMGVSNTMLETLKTMTFAPDWFISNLVPMWRAMAGNPGFLDEIENPEFDALPKGDATGVGTDNEVPIGDDSKVAKNDGSTEMSKFARRAPGYKPLDPQSVMFLGKSIAIGMGLTAFTNYLLNGQLLSPWNVVFGIDGKGRQIKGNIYYAGWARDIVNWSSYYKEEGLVGAMMSMASAKAGPLISPAISTANVWSRGGVDELGNYVYNAEDNPLQKSYKMAEYYAGQAVPAPISVTNPIQDYLKYNGNGGTTLMENALSASGFGYITHNHLNQAEENNYSDTKYQLETKTMHGESLSANETAINILIKQYDPQIKGWIQQREAIAANKNISYQDKLKQTQALDKKIEDLESAALNPSSKFVKSISGQAAAKATAQQNKYATEGSNVASSPF